MDKKTLAKIPVETLSEKLKSMVRDNHRFLVSAHLVCDNEVLMLYFYEVEEVQKGNNKPFMRTFIGKDDYINQDLTTDKTVWKTAALENTDFYYRWYDYKKGIRHYVVGMTLEDEDLIFEYMKEYEKETDDYPWEPIYRFQTQVRDARNKVKQKKETDAIDEVMETLKEVPEDFFKWANEVALSFSRYLIYKDIGKGMAECYCTHCKGNSVIKRKEVELKNNITTVCPVCGSKVTCKAKGKLPRYFSDDRWVGYIEKTEDGFVWRYFHFFRNYYTVNGLVGTEDKNTEYKRTFYSSLLSRKAYEYRYYKDHTLRWCNETNNPWQAINSEYSCLYPNNLPEAWEHIPRMKYSALEILSENMPGRQIVYEEAVTTLSKFPKLEWLIKMGLSKLAEKELSERNSYMSKYYIEHSKLNYSGKTIFEILGLNKENTRKLQIVSGGTDELAILQQAQLLNISITPSQLLEYTSIYGGDTDLIDRVGTASLHKLLNFVKKEAQKYPEFKKNPKEAMRNMTKDWTDYLKWAEGLEYELGDRFFFMPNNFIAVHDRTMQQYMNNKDAVDAALVRKKLEQTKAALEEILGKNEGSDAFAIRGKGLILVIPKDEADLKREGATLHHCVGSYAQRVANGETQIFFIRKESEPDVPYYTLEWKNNDIAQCRGSHNCAMTPEVDAFTQAFKKKMLAAA